MDKNLTGHLRRLQTEAFDRRDLEEHGAVSRDVVGVGPGR
jgi:hypothetical protein